MNSAKIGHSIGASFTPVAAEALTPRRAGRADIYGGAGPLYTTSATSAPLFSRAIGTAAAAVIMGTLVGCQSMNNRPDPAIITFTAPITATDGAPLTGINRVTSYKIHFGHQSRAVTPYLAVRDIGLPSCTNQGGATICTVTWEDTQRGQNCFAVTALNSPNGVVAESDLSNEACVTK
jgi:hypothetical protein